MREIRLGLIGAGRWGQNYIKTIANLKGVRLAVLATRNPRSRQLVSQDCLIFEDWRKAVNKCHIDALIVATPAALHVPMAIEAVINKIPVLVEKPLCHDIVEAVKLREIVAKHNGYVMVDHIHLFNPAYRRLKQLLSPNTSVVEIVSEAGNTGPFKIDAPVLWDWGVHDVALCLDLMEELPIEYEARRLKRRFVNQAVGENLELCMYFSSGRKATCTVGNLMEKCRKLAVRTTSGTLIFDDVGTTKLSRYQIGDDGVHRVECGEVIPVSSEPPLSVVLSEFVSNVRENQNSRDSLEFSINVINVLQNLYKKL
jgi:predicted dehydrogenase